MACSLLDLPVELRVNVYRSFTVEVLSSAYRGLLLSCKELYHEALPEMLKVLDIYYRKEEKEWAEEGGERITIAPPTKLGHATVTFSSVLDKGFEKVWHPLRDTLPLLTLELDHLTYNFGSGEDQPDWMIIMLYNSPYRLSSGISSNWKKTRVVQFRWDWMPVEGHEEDLAEMRRGMREAWEEGRTDHMVEFDLDDEGKQMRGATWTYTSR